MQKPDFLPIGWLQPHFEAAENILRFDRFMELCLYDDENGYYSRHIRSIGPEGDFSTAPAFSPLLAKAVAHSIRLTGLQDVIEIGPGAGHLAMTLRRELKPSFLRFRKRVRYHLVERSPRLQSLLRKKLGCSALVHSSMKDALRASSGAAFIFSNELVDAFPVRVFQKGEKHWQELSLCSGEAGIAERWLPGNHLPDSTLFAQPWTSGQRCEVHASYRQWLQSWLPHWKTGCILTIDYGGTPSEIYHRKPAGTVRGYYHHERVTGTELYQLPGKQDLTADVNFDDLVHWGEELGLRLRALLSQREYCGPFLQDPSSAPERFLTDLHGAGQAFKALLQERN